MIHVENLTKRFSQTLAVDSLSLDVAEGEVFGFLGPNGAGKTTTIEICEGLTAADAGTVELLGLNWPSIAAQLRQRIGVQLGAIWQLLDSGGWRQWQRHGTHSQHFVAAVCNAERQ